MQAPLPDMIFRICPFINELHPGCGVVTGVSCLFFIVSFLVAFIRHCRIVPTPLKKNAGKTSRPSI